MRRFRYWLLDRLVGIAKFVDPDYKRPSLEEFTDNSWTIQAVWHPDHGGCVSVSGCGMIYVMNAESARVLGRRICEKAHLAMECLPPEEHR